MGEGGGGLPCPFLKIQKCAMVFQKINALSLEKSALFLCIYRLSFHFKCSFKSILEKKHQIFFPARAYCCMSYMKRLCIIICNLCLKI